MTNYREILRLNSLGINNTRIAASCGCSRTTVVSVLHRARDCGLEWEQVRDWSNKELSDRLFPPGTVRATYKMPDYEYIHREMGKSGETGEIPYKSTQFNKYYNDYMLKTKATMHLNHKPGEVLEVDWAGQNAHIINTDTGELIKAWVFVAVLPYSGYSYVEAFLSQNQECCKR